MTIKNRLRKLEARRDAEGDITEIFVVGGMADGDEESPDATIAGKGFNREVGETVATFRARCCAAARAVGEKIVVYGDLDD
jgi:hypothetical protein